MAERKKLHLIGYASGIAGANSQAGDAPAVIQQSRLIEHPGDLSWVTILEPQDPTLSSVNDVVYDMCYRLATATEALARADEKFCVIGGDHSSAIGTWSGVFNAMHHQGDLGLIWIDAHMDSHTPETSESGRIHGMPLAVLLGKGHQEFTTILNDFPKIKPQNVCLIGIRSYEEGEAATLRDLGVRVYYMKEVKERGYLTVLREAVAQVKRDTTAFGMTFDIDSLDPEEAPGVDVPEADGIHVTEFYEGLRELVQDPQLIATEIVEFDPTHDKDLKTEKVVATCLDIISQA